MQAQNYGFPPQKSGSPDDNFNAKEFILCSCGLEIVFLQGMKRHLRIFALAAAATLVCGCAVTVRHPHAVKEAFCRLIPGKTVRYSGEDIMFADTFNDINRKHLSAAMNNGLQEMPETRNDVDTASMARISSCERFMVDPLPYSMPYLAWNSADELATIGQAFSDHLESNGLPSYRLIVTSLLRTKEDVDRLSEVNINSSGHSAHCYGTTFDISWSRFDKTSCGGKTMKGSDLKTVLGEVLREERSAGKIYVKYEIRQKCFHITSRK